MLCWNTWPSPPVASTVFFRHDGHRFSGSGRQHERTEAGKRRVAVRYAVGVVRECQQVNRDRAGMLGNSGCLRHPPGHVGKYRMPGQVLRMDDAAGAVPALACKLQPAAFITVKFHVQLIHQEIPDGSRA